MSADGEQGGVLLPCPFCGGEAPTVWVYREKHSMFPQWVAHCKLCNITQKANTKAYAILAWNTRATPATDTPEVVRKTLEQCVGIESGANGQGGMRVVVHFKGGGDEYPLFSLLNAALAKHPTSPEDAA